MVYGRDWSSYVDIYVYPTKQESDADAQKNNSQNKKQHKRITSTDTTYTLQS